MNDYEREILSAKEEFACGVIGVVLFLVGAGVVWAWAYAVI
jgi:hypothetical protein